jgi:hypothetical protein
MYIVNLLKVTLALHTTIPSKVLIVEGPSCFARGNSIQGAVKVRPTMQIGSIFFHVIM